MSYEADLSPIQTVPVQLELLFADIPEVASAPRYSPHAAPARRVRKDPDRAETVLLVQGDKQLRPPIAESLGLHGPAARHPEAEFGQGPSIEVEHLARTDSPITMVREVKAKLQPDFPQNLAVVMATITADLHMAKQKRIDFRSALRCLARIAGTDLALIPTTPNLLRELFVSILPAAHGVSDGRWRHIRSRVTRAIQHAGAPITPGRFTSTLSFAWNELAEALPNIRGKIGLGRFMRYCTGRGIEPSNVSQAVFDAFFDALQLQTKKRSPTSSYQTTCTEWNRAAGTVPSWPPIKAVRAKNKRHYASEWSVFPASFRADVDGYFTRAANPDPFEDGVLRILKPSTVQLQRRQVLQMASLLVHTGVPAEEITNLATLTEIENAKRLLKAARQRLGDQSPHLSGMSQLLKTLAKKWCGSPTATVKKLAAFTALVTPKKIGVTEKNKARLRQFDDPENLIGLWDMPEKVFARLAKQVNPDIQAARQALYALAVAFLSAIPLRAGNLFALDRTRHIVPVGRGRHRVWHLVIPPHEVKNEEAIEAHLPPALCAMLEVYQTRYLPLICNTPTNLLFPNEKGKIRDLGTAGTTTCRVVRTETGLVMNPHLFRHLAVTSYLHYHPDDFETARRILGHRRITTTMRYYAYIKTTDAFRRFSALAEQLRAPNIASTGRAKRLGKGSR